jgi:hypothetical protein
MKNFEYPRNYAKFYMDRFPFKKGELIPVNKGWGNGIILVSPDKSIALVDPENLSTFLEGLGMTPPTREIGEEEISLFDEKGRKVTLKRVAEGIEITLVGKPEDFLISPYPFPS